MRAWPKWLQPSEPAPAEPPKADPLPPTPTSKATIDALCDILGEQCEDEEAKRAAEEAEADRVRASARLRSRLRNRARERLKAFRAVSTSTLRPQQLQMVFLDLPILPTALHDLILGSDAKAGKRGATIADLPDVDWFDVTLPSDGKRGADVLVGEKPKRDVPEGRNRGENTAKGENTSDGSVRASVKSLIGVDDLTPEYVDYDGERVPGEFSIPVVPYPFVCHPGSQVRLNLFEPRWLTLFAKLMRDPGETVSDTAPLVLEGARENANRIDLSRNEYVRAYEEGNDTDFDIVPGSGRMDESPFVGTERFGALYRRADGKVAGVGTAMRLVAHDVVVNGKLHSVYARGETRFRVLRIRQVNPYLVVDAVPLEDEGAVAEVADQSDAATSASASGSGEFGGDAAYATNVGGSMDSNEADVAVGSSKTATALASCMDRLIVADPYYSEAVGLGEAWNMDKSLKRSVGAMNEFDVANAVLYAKPEAALRVLASGSSDQRKEAVLNAVRGMEAALAAGLTPRKARLLRSLGAMADLLNRIWHCVCSTNY